MEQGPGAPNPNEKALEKKVAPAKTAGLAAAGAFAVALGAASPAHAPDINIHEALLQDGHAQAEQMQEVQRDELQKNVFKIPGTDLSYRIQSSPEAPAASTTPAKAPAPATLHKPAVEKDVRHHGQLYSDKEMEENAKKEILSNKKTKGGVFNFENFP